MRMYSGYQQGGNDNKPQPRLPKMSMYAFMLVVGVVLVVNIFNGRGETAGNDTIRFYYAVTGNESRLEHMDISFAGGDASGVVEALENGFKNPPRGGNFLLSIGGDVYINKVVSYENTVEIDFTAPPLQNAAVAYTMLDMYDAGRVFITVDGEVVWVAER